MQPYWLQALQAGEINFGGDVKALTFALKTAGSPAGVRPLVEMLRAGKVPAEREENVLSVIAALGSPQAMNALLVKGDSATDLATGATVTPLPANLDAVVINNRLRREIGSAMAALRLTVPDRAVRLAAARELQNGADEDLLPAITRAIGSESFAVKRRSRGRSHERRTRRKSTRPASRRRGNR